MEDGSSAGAAAEGTGAVGTAVEMADGNGVVTVTGMVGVGGTGTGGVIAAASAAASGWMVVSAGDCGSKLVEM